MKGPLVSVPQARKTPPNPRIPERHQLHSPCALRDGWSIFPRVAPKLVIRPPRSSLGRHPPQLDKKKDQPPDGSNVYNLNGVARGAYKHYNADDMHGLSVGVQVIGRRLEEEKVLTLMKRVEDALGDDKFKLLELD